MRKILGLIIRNCAKCEFEKFKFDFQQKFQNYSLDYLICNKFHAIREKSEKLLKKKKKKG